MTIEGVKCNTLDEILAEGFPCQVQWPKDKVVVLMTEYRHGSLVGEVIIAGDSFKDSHQLGKGAKDWSTNVWVIL